MICTKMTTPFSRGTNIGEDMLPLKSLVVCKTEPSSCFSCKTDMMWVVPFPKKIRAICCLRQGPAARTVRSSNTLFLRSGKKVVSFLTEVTAIGSRIVTYAAVVTFKTKKINKNQLRLIRLSTNGQQSELSR